VTAWLLREPSPAVTGRVFCLPHAGCGAAVFGGWPDRVGGIEFLPVELPGRLARFGEPMPATVGELAQDMIGGLGRYLDRPFAFFGHCWSATVAYEVTARLQTAGTPPAHLYVSSQVAPQDGPAGRMLDMDDGELIAELEATIRARGNEPHRELVALSAAVLRSDVELSRRYVVPDPPRVNCPITAFGWTDDQEVRPERMAGWSVCGATTFAVFDGRHERFLDAPPELLETLCAGIRRPTSAEAAGW
jgi:surfactin synthase thioesterase subunit